MKQLDFFKALMHVGGFSVKADAYADRITLSPSRVILDNVTYARDWSSKRDAPDLFDGEPRNVAYRDGAFGQANLLKWAENECVKKGYGDGVWRLEDETLPATYTIATLPFATTEPNEAVPGLLRIVCYKLRENEAPFARAEYDTSSPKPRLTRLSDQWQTVTLVEAEVSQEMETPITYFDDPE